MQIALANAKANANCFGQRKLPWPTQDESVNAKWVCLGQRKMSWPTQVALANAKWVSQRKMGLLWSTQNESAKATYHALVNATQLPCLTLYPITHLPLYPFIPLPHRLPRTLTPLFHLVLVLLLFVRFLTLAGERSFLFFAWPNLGKMSTSMNSIGPCKRF